MSWGEIRKFVNNGNTPLNELLGEACETLVATGTAHNEFKTVLSVEGSGRLHCVSVSNKTRSDSKIVITVDGEVVLDCSLSCTDTNYPNLLHVGNDSQIETIVHNSSGKLAFACPFFIVRNTSYDLEQRHCLPFKSETQSMSAAGSLVRVNLTAPLRFDNSLMIQIKGTSTNDNYGILYDLG